MQQGDNMMETADMTMNGCSLSGPGGAMENSTTHKNIRQKLLLNRKFSNKDHTKFKLTVTI